jgi:hypothetical protein
MKAYQEAWLEDLEEITHTKNTYSDNNLLAICCNIVGDDTGTTDALTRTLAEILRNRIVKDMTTKTN